MNQGSNFLGGTFRNRENVRPSIQLRRKSQPQHLNDKWTKHWKLSDSLKIQWFQWPVHLHLKNQLKDHGGCDICQNGKVIDRINKSGCSYSLQQYEIDTLEPNKNIFNTKNNIF